MAKDSWEKQRDALGKLSRVFVEEARGGLLREALDHLIAAAGLTAGAAFTVNETAGVRTLELAAERGLGAAASVDAPGPESIRRALVEIGMRAVSTRRTAPVTDVTAVSGLDAESLLALASREFHTAVAIPVKHQRQVLSVLVLVGKIVPDTPTLSVLETGGNIVALATERDRRTEREQVSRGDLAQVAPMVSLGLVTATVVHELRAPLHALVVQIEEEHRLLERLESSHDLAGSARSELVELLSDMRVAAAQIDALVSQLGELSRRGAPPEQLDLRAIAQEALALARLELTRRTIRVVEDYAPGCVTHGSRAGLLQVAVNLVFHAADACTASGRTDPTITIRTRDEVARVVLSVEDTGPGVPSGEIQDIFDPFTSGKRKSSYAGLSLKICSDVVTSHHGHIEVVNLEGGGAAFRVLLPRVVEAERSAKPPSTSPSGKPPAQIRKVLVVDDDDLFSRTMKRGLKPHDVRIAASASEAEIALLDAAYSPHLVVCDIGLPGFGGDALHARVRAKRPEIAARFVFVTGGACSKTEADYVRSSGCPTLLKPIDTKELLEALAAPTLPVSVVPADLATLRSDPPRSE
jgi:signal transduction histidine kinase/ActR/RegA family two-component response regulator